MSFYSHLVPNGTSCSHFVILPKEIKTPNYFLPCQFVPIPPFGKQFVNLQTVSIIMKLTY